MHVSNNSQRAPAVHIDDLTSLYERVIDHIIKKKPAPGAESEYYFVMAHRSSWWAVMDRIAAALYSRALVSQSEPRFWSSDEEAAKKLGFPLAIIAPSQKSE